MSETQLEALRALASEKGLLAPLVDLEEQIDKAADEADELKLEINTVKLSLAEASTEVRVPHPAYAIDRTFSRQATLRHTLPPPPPAPS